VNNLRRRTLVGLGWTGAARLLGQILQLGTTVVLARLLSPKEYGLLGMVLVFTGFANYVADMGLGASIIQKATLSDRHLNSVFWLNAATGLALTVIFALAAPLVASFYGEPQLYLLTVAIAPNFLLGSLNVVQNALLDKALNFRIKFWIEIVAAFASGLVALVLALRGWGVWSLVGQSLALTTVRVLMMWVQSSWRPAMAFDFSAIRELMRFSGHLTGFGAVFYWSQNVDKLIIGRWIGSSALGIYTLADKLMRLSLANINDVTSSVMFPALSSIQRDVDAVKRAYLRATRMTSFIVFPMMIALGVLAEPAILVVYGGKWRESIPILRLLCVAGVSLSTYSTAGWIFMSQGRTDILFRLGVYATVVRAIAVLIGAHWGLTGVAWAYVIGGYVFIWYPTWASAGRLMNLSFTALLSNVAGPFACAASMGAVLWATDHWVFGGWVVEPRLVIQLVLGALVYAVLVRRFRVRAWVEIGDILLDMGANRSRLLCWLLGHPVQADPK
jgi:O-antigen/teichoic acid export membrane protein